MIPICSFIHPYSLKLCFRGEYRSALRDTNSLQPRGSFPLLERERGPELHAKCCGTPWRYTWKKTQVFHHKDSRIWMNSKMFPKWPLQNLQRMGKSRSRGHEDGGQIKTCEQSERSGRSVRIPLRRTYFQSKVGWGLSNWSTIRTAKTTAATTTTTTTTTTWW